MIDDDTLLKDISLNKIVDLLNNEDEISKEDANTLRNMTIIKYQPKSKNT